MKKLIVLLCLGLFVSACGHHKYRGCPKKKMEKMDTNKDGKISKSEFKAYKMGKFAKKDTNNDGFLSLEELKACKKSCKKKCCKKKCSKKSCDVKGKDCKNSHCSTKRKGKKSGPGY